MEWRAFESPPWTDGAPDYTAARFDERYATYKGLRARLDAIDPEELGRRRRDAELTTQAHDRAVLRLELRGAALPGHPSDPAGSGKGVLGGPRSRWRRGIGPPEGRRPLLSLASGRLCLQGVIGEHPVQLYFPYASTW